MIVLAPYVWNPQGPTGKPCWMPPGPGVDLRRRSEQASRGGVIGYGIFEVADDAKIDGAVEFTGNATRDRDAWESTLGVRPSGSTPEEMLWSHLIDGDDTGADRARPLRASGRDDFELHFGGRKERKLRAADKLQQAVFIRRDLDKIFDDVEAGKLPPGLHRKMLAMEAARLGIDPNTLKSKSARWRNERAEEPQTVLCSTFQDLSRFDVFSGSWSVSGSAVTLNSPENEECHIRHKGSLSSSNHEAYITTANYNSSGGSLFIMFRASEDATSGTIDGYWSGTFQNDLFLFSYSNSVSTLLQGRANYVGAASHAIRGDCNGSTIRAATRLTEWHSTVTNTAHTSGVRTLIGSYKHDSSSSRTASGFRAFDGGSLAPAPTSVSPSSGPTAGGTAIEVTGTNFDLDSTVAVKGGSANSVVVYDDTKITAVTPARTAGQGDVGVTTGGGAFSGSLVNGFTYTDPTTTTTAATTTTTVATTTTTARQSAGPRTILGSRRIGHHGGLSGN
jgi:hypothetical protein